MSAFLRVALVGLAGTTVLLSAELKPSLPPLKPVPSVAKTNTPAAALNQSLSTGSQEAVPFQAHVRYADSLEPTLAEQESAWKTVKRPVGTNSVLKIQIFPQHQYVSTGPRDSIAVLHRPSWTSLPREERTGPEPGIALFRFTRLPSEVQPKSKPGIQTP